mmetsp:Transcript_146925/g.409261  ORF Transcript_146925/g.409261 Transcript_146925/m.409261 type:complete len:383 (+) Transcript_146925:32-1180(+)
MDTLLTLRWPFWPQERGSGRKRGAQSRRVAKRTLSLGGEPQQCPAFCTPRRHKTPTQKIQQTKNMITNRIIGHPLSRSPLVQALRVVEHVQDTVVVANDPDHPERHGEPTARAVHGSGREVRAQAVGREESPCHRQRGGAECGDQHEDDEETGHAGTGEVGQETHAQHAHGAARPLENAQQGTLRVTLGPGPLPPGLCLGRLLPVGQLLTRREQRPHFQVILCAGLAIEAVLLRRLAPDTRVRWNRCGRGRRAAVAAAGLRGEAAVGLLHHERGLRDDKVQCAQHHGGPNEVVSVVLPALDVDLYQLVRQHEDGGDKRRTAAVPEAPGHAHAEGRAIASGAAEGQQRAEVVRGDDGHEAEHEALEQPAMRLHEGGGGECRSR